MLTVSDSIDKNGETGLALLSKSLHLLPPFLSIEPGTSSIMLTFEYRAGLEVPLLVHL
jgi:hypothetical protein